MKAYQKYSTLLSLYVAQSIPMSFFSTVLPVIMRMENYSLESIGLFQLIKIPWILKFLWAPLVDRTSGGIRQYRSWIWGSELFYAMAIIGMGFFSLQSDFMTILVLMIIAFTISATQDIASDAMAIHILRKSQRGMGNSMQSAGNFLGTLFGSGVLLMLYARVGWQGLTFLLSGIVLVALLPLFMFVRAEKTDELPVPGRKRASLKDIPSFFRMKGAARRVALLAVYYSGILGILVMLKPMLVDLGYSVQQIAFMVGIYGTGIGAASAFLGGLLIRRLGNRATLVLVAAYNFLVALFFYRFVWPAGATFVMYTGIALIWSGYAMASVVVYTISMNLVRPGREGTDYSLQIIVTHLSGLAVSVLSGQLAGALGYEGLFLVECLWAAGVVVLSMLLYTEPGTSGSVLADLFKRERGLLWKYTRK